MRNSNKKYFAFFTFIFVSAIFSQTGTITGGNVVSNYWNNTNTGLTVTFNFGYSGGSYTVYGKVSGSSPTILKSTGFGEPSGSTTDYFSESIIESIVGRTDGISFVVYINQYNSSLQFQDSTYIGTYEFQDQTAPSQTTTPNLYADDDSGYSHSDNKTKNANIRLKVENITTGDRRAHV